MFRLLLSLWPNFWESYYISKRENKDGEKEMWEAKGWTHTWTSWSNCNSSIQVHSIRWIFQWVTNSVRSVMHRQIGGTLFSTLIFPHNRNGVCFFFFCLASDEISIQNFFFLVFLSITYLIMKLIQNCQFMYVICPFLCFVLNLLNSRKKKLSLFFSPKVLFFEISIWSQKLFNSLGKPYTPPAQNVYKMYLFFVCVLAAANAVWKMLLFFIQGEKSKQWTSLCQTFIESDGKVIRN